MTELAVDIEDGTEVTGPDDSVRSLKDNEVIDYITGEPVPDTFKEQVRQRIGRALILEYGIDPDDMARDFAVPIRTEDGKRRRPKADIAIFEHGEPHDPAHLRRVVICKPEPKNGNKVTKIRTHEQARAELDELKDLMGDEESPCQWGLWTNGVDLFFLEKLIGRFGPSFEYRADWPQAGESLGSRSVASHARLRRADADMLRTTFRRCHNFIHGNEGMPKDAAFWQFLYLLYAKMHDERMSSERGTPARFFASFDEPFTSEGQDKIKERIDKLFADVKQDNSLFGARDEIVLSKYALGFLVGELAPYDLSATDIDAKGIAYQELVGVNLRGDRGQYFTPRQAVRLMATILDPQEHQTVLDPACGTGGFLRETLRHLHDEWRAADGVRPGEETSEQKDAYLRRLRSYAKAHLYGADFDPFLVRATSMNVMMLTGGEGNAFYIDSLAFPGGGLPGLEEARKAIPLGTVDVLMTNPPFGSDIKVTDPTVLEHYRHGVAQSWSRDRESGRLVSSSAGRGVPTMAPEQLFIQRAVEWVTEGGRIGIVLPNGILSNPGPADEATRRWILDNCWILASIELPVETFIVDANVNILTTLLFLKKKTERERIAADAGVELDYPVFMAVAEKVGVDRRGNPVYQRWPDGEVKLTDVEKRETVRIGERKVVRTLRRKERTLDDDIPAIAEQYRAFRRSHPEPGLPAETLR